MAVEPLWLGARSESTPAPAAGGGQKARAQRIHGLLGDWREGAAILVRIGEARRGRVYCAKAILDISEEPADLALNLAE